MSIEGALHTVWATDKALCDLVPSDRVYTGRVLGEFSLPYATINREGAVPAFRASGRSEGWQYFFRLDVYTHHDELQTGIDAVARFSELINRRSLPLHDVDVSLMTCQRAGGPEQTLTPDGVWELSASYEITLHEKVGVGADG